MTRSFHVLQTCGAALGIGLATILIGVPAVKAQTQPPQPPAAKDTKDSAKEIKDSAKDTANQDKDRARDSAQTAKDQAKDTGQNAARDVRDTGRDASRDIRSQRDQDGPGAARDNRSDNRDQGGSAPRDDRNMQGRDSQYRGSQNRDTQARDNRGAPDRDSQYRDNQNRDNRSSSQNTFRASDIRSADIGIWFDRSARDGLVISDVASKGAIARVGFREGDRIISVNGQHVTRDADFIQYLFADNVRNDRVKVVVLRDNREEVVYVEPNLLVEEYGYEESDPLEQFGVVLDDRYDDRIVVWKVIPRSPAFYAGIRAGDVFTTFRGQPVSSRQDFVKVVTNLDAGNVPVQVRRGDRVRDYAVDVPRYDNRAQRRTAMRPYVDVERPNERREGRIEERRENRVEGNTPATPLRPRR